MPRLGQAHHNAKMTDAQVIDMRKTHAGWKAAGSWKGYGELGALFGCSKWTARDIVTHRTRHTTGRKAA